MVIQMVECKGKATNCQYYWQGQCRYSEKCHLQEGEYEGIGLWHWCKLDACIYDGPQCHSCEHMDWEEYKEETGDELSEL